MNPRSLVPTLAIVASCSASVPQPRDTKAADEAAIEAVMQQYVADIRANAPAKVAAAWADDAMFIDRAAPTVRGRAELDSFVNGEFAAVTVKDAAVEKDDLAVSGDIAYYIGRYHEALQQKTGAAVDERGRFIVILKRQSDGKWKIARFVGTELAKNAAAAPAAVKDSSKKRG